MPQTPPPAASSTPQPAVTGSGTPAAAGGATSSATATPGGAASSGPAGPVPPGADEAALPLVPRFGHRPGARRPLPDAMAVHRLEVPDSAPPYDDELGVRMLPRRAPGGAGPDRQPSPVPSAAGPPDTTGPAGTAGPADTATEAAAGAAGRDRDQAAAGWPSQFAQVLAETLAGSRPPGQITPWTTEQARRRIRQLGPLLAARQQPQVRRVVTSRPADDVVEIAAVVAFGQSVRALAVRLERNGAQRASPGRDARPARWLCTAVEAA